MDEAQRLEHLRGQALTPWLPPEEARPLVSRAGLTSKTIEAASRAWWAAGEAVARGDASKEYLLVYLTRALAAYYRRTGEPSRGHDVYERALSALVTPSYRQIVFSGLSRSAGRAGDQAAAERWLASCDPASVDLAADTAYRLARARLATLRRDFRGVLSLLGGAPGDVPIHANWLISCGMLRANAFERLGNIDHATSLLLELAKVEGNEWASFDPSFERWRSPFLQRMSKRKKRAISPDRWHHMVSSRVHSPDLDLCPASLAAADAELHRDAPRVAGTGSMGCAAAFVLALGVGATVGAIILFLRLDGGRPWGALHWIGVGIAACALLMNSIGLGLIVKSLREWSIRKHGTPAPAIVDGLREYDLPGEHANLMVEVTLEARPPGAQPVRTSVHLPIQDDAYRRCFPGATVQIRFAPKRPSDAFLDETWRNASGEAALVS